MKIVAWDTEGTGLDWSHAARPYMVMTYATNGESFYWKWPVNPFTRKVRYKPDDLLEFIEYLFGFDVIVAHNHTYDVHMVDQAFADCNLPRIDWPWHKMEDTMSSAHLLGSSSSKNLTDQVVKYCGADISKYERAIERATKQVRDLVGLKAFIDENGKWFKTYKHAPGLPSAGEEGWKGDMWMPETLVRMVRKGKVDKRWLPESRQWTHKHPTKLHPWTTPLDDYAIADPQATYHLYLAHQQVIRRKGLKALYESRKRVIKTAYKLESNGLTLSKSRRDELSQAYKRECRKLSKRGVRLANVEGFDQMPAGTTKMLKHVLFKKFKLVAHVRTSSGSEECTKGEVVDRWLEELPPTKRAHKFLTVMKAFRQRTTANNYMRGYERYWHPTQTPDVYRLHPSLNYFGPRTLRTSSSAPNEQNISKKEGFNLRYAFGPEPGRVWAAIDYENQELRIPAYASGEEALIRLFEDPTAPPYYGSNHLLNFETVYPDLWAQALRESGGLEYLAKWIKTNWKSTWYQRCKNGGFAVQYGSIDVDDPDRMSTADRAFHRKGCHKLLKQRFAALEAENQRCIKQANRTGFVTTLPDRTVNPKKGYPLQCTRDERGNISPTQPLNTRVQGTACWITGRATFAVEDYLDEINRKFGWADPLDLHHKHRGAFVTAQIHDELVLDLPLRRPDGRPAPYKRILKRVQGIMEGIGDDVNVPMKTGCDLHYNNWSD